MEKKFQWGLKPHWALTRSAPGRRSWLHLITVPQVTSSVMTKGISKGRLPQGHVFVVGGGPYTKITESQFVVIAAPFGTKCGDL